jgi:uncharacterized membrane protein YgcG
VQSRPELYCISSGTTVQDTTCACMTEQGTKYPMRLDFCALMARDGPDYSRYREARQSGQTGAQASSGGGGGVGGGGHPQTARRPIPCHSRHSRRAR